MVLTFLTLFQCFVEFASLGVLHRGSWHESHPVFLLRRMNMARSALRRADPATTSVAEIARKHQFLELGRFAVTYRTIFGEMPSTTLRRVSD